MEHGSIKASATAGPAAGAAPVSGDVAALPIVDDMPEPPSPRQRRGRPFALDEKTEFFFEKITQVAPVILYVFDLQTMENVWVNRSVFDYLGYTQKEIAALGPDLLADLMHPEDRDLYGAHHERLLTLGPTDVARFEYRMRHKDGGWCWLISEDMAYARDENDRVCQIVGSAHDMTEAREREERIRLLMREMNHRVKNLFAVIGSMISLSGREKTDTKTALRNVRARVNALALAHTISIGEAQERDSALRDVVELILTPYAEDHEIAVTGDNPPLPWRAITPVGLIVHELATNAAKYGALHERRGRVAVTIQERSGTVTMVWREFIAPAPPAADMAHEGFGAVLTAQAAHQLGGSLTRRWRETPVEEGIAHRTAKGDADHGQRDAPDGAEDARTGGVEVTLTFRI